jgi:uncharacterized protein YggE
MKYFFLSLFICSFASTNAQEIHKYITVNGTSEIILPADQIKYTIQIKIVAAAVEASKNANDSCRNELLRKLNKIGINSNDINVLPMTLGKNYEFNKGERKQRGFYTEVNVVFLLKDLSKYYELTNELSSSNQYEIKESTYNISDYELQQKIAFEKALLAAKEKAKYMVHVLGVKLKDVLEIEENNYWQAGSIYSNTIEQKQDSRAGDMSGKVTIRRSVKVKFAIN